jgi:hypothetical protein
MFRFTLRDVFWFTLLTALLLTLWREGVELDNEKRNLLNDVRRASSAVKELRTSEPYFVAAGWHTVADPDDYELRLDSVVRHGGDFSALVNAKSSAPADYAYLSQAVRADEYLGKRVRFSGYVRTENVTTASVSIGTKRGVESFVDSHCRQTLEGSNDWQRFDLVLDIPGRAALIAFGLVAQGGAAWIDDLAVEVVDSDVPTSPPMDQHEYVPRLRQPRVPKNFPIPTQPLCLDFEPRYPD